MTDWSHDLVLRALQDLDEPVGSLIRAYPGRAAANDDQAWLEGWFRTLTQQFADGRGPDPKAIIGSSGKETDLSPLARQPVEVSTRIVWIHPHYFRGFRSACGRISFDADLVVVEGRNSSGKTSLSEAIEWTLTGRLSRRTSGDHGHPAELADCICNEFRPQGDETWVELCLRIDKENFVLRRVLTRDYARAAVDAPVSELYVNGTLSTVEQEIQLRERLFAGVDPLLMQHNLRRFVHAAPAERRQYFERLLQVDELTGIIEKAVAGARLLERGANPNGRVGIEQLRALATELEGSAIADSRELAMLLRKVEKERSDAATVQFSHLLCRIAQSHFSNDVRDAADLSGHRNRVEEAQTTARAAEVPTLTSFEHPRRHPAPTCEQARAIAASLEKLPRFHEALAGARKGAAAISEAHQELARATARLVAVGLIEPEQTQSQICAICEHPSATLAPARIAEIGSWLPSVSALGAAEQSFRNAQSTALNDINQLKAAIDRATPRPCSSEPDVHSAATSARVIALTRVAVTSAEQLRTLATASEDILAELERSVRSSPERPVDASSATQVLSCTIETYNAALHQHRADVAQLVDAVNLASRTRDDYRLRECWLRAAEQAHALAYELDWEHAKVRAKNCLEEVRSALIDLRVEIIEHARKIFTDEISTIWRLLRSDSNAQFHRLCIPPAKGKGYKLELELKAHISDGQSTSEVDALRVFSESQVNVVGIAAYVTRAKLLGHTLLVLDDPVQSMDEEHFRSFAGALLPTLIDEGRQVIIFTHSETFARCVHDKHFLRSSYATLETKPSRRKGCCVAEGNRRVCERLKNAEHLASEGDLPGAWRLIRIALERLYTVVQIKHVADFDPESWRNLTAEDMWNRGVGDLVARLKPEGSKRLQEILRATAAGAHDKASPSETDVVEAAKYVAALLSPLRVGGG